MYNNGIDVLKTLQISKEAQEEIWQTLAQRQDTRPRLEKWCMPCMPDALIFSVCRHVLMNNSDLEIQITIDKYSKDEQNTGKLRKSDCVA